MRFSGKFHSAVISRRYTHNFEATEMSEQDELVSAIGVDYIQLHELLAAGQWQKADEETGAVMLKIACRVTAGWRKS